MKEKKEIRVGQVGHMFMGVAHSNAFRNAAAMYDLPYKITMKAVCGKDTDENLAAFADRFGWESYEQDWKKLVQRDDIDLICIAAPGFLHKDIAVEAAKNGKHILCEKPLANTLAEAEEMVEAVKAAGIRHCCGYTYRMTPAQAMAKQLFDQGKVGRVYDVFVRYAQDWLCDPDFAYVWRHDKDLAGSGALGDICAHSIDGVRFITGMEITRLVSQLKTLIHERPIDADKPDGEKGKVTVDDVAQFLCEFDNGAPGCYEASRMAMGRRNYNSIEIAGDKGSLFWTFEEQNYLYFFDNTRPSTEQGFSKINCTHNDHPYGGGYWPIGHNLGYGDMFVNQARLFLNAIVHNEEFHPDFDDGLKVQEVLDAIERSATEQKWVSL